MVGFDNTWLAAHQAKMAGFRQQAMPPIPDRIQFALPVLLKLPNRTLGQPWQAAYAQRKKLAPMVDEATREWQGRVPMERARVTVTRYSLGVADDDNVAASIKPLVDLLLVRNKTHPSSVGLVVDDSPDHMDIRWGVVRVATRVEQRTEVLIEKL